VNIDIIHVVLQLALTQLAPPPRTEGQRGC